MLQRYFQRLYKRTMDEAYGLAHQSIFDAVANGGMCLDCGAQSGHKFELLKTQPKFNSDQYVGIEWCEELVDQAIEKNINVVQGDLNKALNFENNIFQCIFGLSVLEHLLNPCHFLKESYRCLDNDGTLVLLTPNISTFFTIALLLVGKMPSSGPHPDSDSLLIKEEVFKVSNNKLKLDTEADTPMHRHLIVFSYRVLKTYLAMIGFRDIKGYGFGLYPFPSFMQKPLEKLDPYHCHQMVFVAKK